MAVSPPRPPRTIYALVLYWLFSGFSAIAQTGAGTQLRDYPTYAASTKQYFNALWTADRAEYVNIQKGKNWNLVPSVGLVFGLPSINLNTGQIANLKQRQSETRAKLKSLELRYTVLLNEALNNVRIELVRAEVERQKLDALTAVLATKKRIFSIQEEAYQKRELTPLVYYRERMSYESAVQDQTLAGSAYRLLVLGIEKLAHYHTPDEVIYYTDVASEDEGRGSLDTAPGPLPPVQP